MNAIAVLYGIAKGNVVTDPSLPIADFKITSNNFGAAYVRTFGLANKLSRVQVVPALCSHVGEIKNKRSGYQPGPGPALVIRV